MAVCKTMKTHKGISKFLINSDYGNDSIAAFIYDDDQIEVHSLKKECAPLHLEADSSMGTVNIEGVGVLVYVITPNISNNVLDLAIWDVGSFVGFTPKEIHKKTEQKKDVKYKYPMNIESMFSEDLVEHLSTAHNDHICILINNKFLISIKVELSTTNHIDVDFILESPIADHKTMVTNMAILDSNGLFLAYSIGTDINVVKLTDENLTSSIMHLPVKKSKATSISSFLKLSASKCLIIDNVGHLYIFAISKNIAELKLPNSLFGHSVCAVGNIKNDGVLAICNENHSVNLYLIKDIVNSVTENNSMVYVKPYRLLCSQYPINAIAFMKGDQLAMASSANKLITFWGGVTRNYDFN